LFEIALIATLFTISGWALRSRRLAAFLA